jgi:hypothetical protein
MFQHTFIHGHEVPPVSSTETEPSCPAPAAVVFFATNSEENLRFHPAGIVKVADKS